MQFLKKKLLNPFQSSVAFHIKIIHLICNAKQLSGMYVKFNTGLKLVKGRHNILLDISACREKYFWT